MTLTPEQMEQTMVAHEIAEFHRDIDATVDTLTAEPVYEFPNLGVQIQGREAIREMYTRMLPNSAKYNIWADRRTYSFGPNTIAREAYISFDTDSGRSIGQYVAIIEFDGDKIQSERMYMDEKFAVVMQEMLGSDFGEVPGVVRLDDALPAPRARPERREDDVPAPES